MILESELVAKRSFADLVESLAYVSNPRVDYDAAHKNVSALSKRYFATLYPWLAGDDDRKAQQEKEFNETWAQVAGFDPSDSEAKNDWELAILEELEKRQNAVQEEEKKQAAAFKAYFDKVDEIYKRRLKQLGRNTWR